MKRRDLRKEFAGMLMLMLMLKALPVLADEPSRTTSDRPASAYDYAKLCEPELGVPPKVDLAAGVEIPIYVNGMPTVGNPGVHCCDNPSLQVGDCMSGSVLQRHPGRTADGKPLPHVVWVSFGRHNGLNSKGVFKNVDTVQLIGYNSQTGATAFFESGIFQRDYKADWTSTDPKTNRMTGVMPGIDDPKSFNAAYVRPSSVNIQCVACHQSDPFIHNPFVDAARLPDDPEQPVVPEITGTDAPYYVIGESDWDMRTIHLEGNGCLSCHRIGMKTVEEFLGDRWDPNKHMPPDAPGSMSADFQELLRAWKSGPTGNPGFQWVIPPAGREPRRIVGDEYPHKAPWNSPAADPNAQPPQNDLPKRPDNLKENQTDIQGDHSAKEEKPAAASARDPSAQTPVAEMTEAEKKSFVEKLLIEKGVLDPRGWNFPKTAFEYAKMVEPELGVPPRIDLSLAVEIPLYVDGIRSYGNLRQNCDNPSLLGKDTVSGSTLQRYEGRTADGVPLPEVVWVSFGRNSTRVPGQVLGSVQMIGYNRRTGATAFFESSDQIQPWVTLDQDTMRMRGVMPWIDDPEEFNQAYRVPDPFRPQCVQCHQADPFITNSFINAAKVPGSNETVVPILDQNSPYYVIGGENWDMRTIHVDGNKCLDCHRVGLSTVTMFMANGWQPNQHMPPNAPGSLTKDLEQLLEAWKKGPSNVQGAKWIVPPAGDKELQTVGEDYPNKAIFNEPGRAAK